eukprot:TRINITY_DN51462_c0_g1_i1.p1 TRINITY_DN51462_c0_g1~~TRINITY_DN51462_c0_g1_i1.p1  ORF type:complete len:182 (+),score=60.07 TRINITY_DN51462_c0_g1_i1:82-546(+)
MALPPLSGKHCVQQDGDATPSDHPPDAGGGGRKPVPLTLMDSGGNPELVPYSAVTWEAVPVPSGADTGDLGSTSPAARSRLGGGVSPPKKGKRHRNKDGHLEDTPQGPSLQSNEAWHHSAQVFDQGDDVAAGSSGRRRSKSKGKRQSAAEDAVT